MKTMKATKSKTIRAIYEEMELYLISSMRRNLERHKAEELKEGFKFEQWQNAKLRDLERFRRENSAIIDRFEPAIEAEIERGIRRSFKRARDNVIKFAKGLFAKRPAGLPEGAAKVMDAIEHGRLNIPGKQDPIFGKRGDDLKEMLKKSPEIKEIWETTPQVREDSFFRMNDRKMRELVKVHTQELRKANSAVLRRMDDVYRETIMKAQVFYNSGTHTLSQAIDMATKDFLAKGIDAITYKDGTRVNIASYAEMALRTANHRAYLAAEGDKRKELGIATVIVSQHGTACPLCVPWELAILIDDVYSGGKKEDGDYPLLSDAMKANFLHPNCQHNMVTYYPGVTTTPERKDVDKSAEWYKASQKQRALERQIRTQKRVVEGTVDEQKLKAEQRKLKELQAKMRQHLKDNPQSRRSPEREKAVPEAEKLFAGHSPRPTKIIKGHDPTPKTANPNAIIDRIGEDGKVNTRGFYYEKGEKIFDINTTDHGNPKQHSLGEHGEHAHDYIWNEDGSLNTRKRRELTDKERIENRDILQRRQN